MRKNIRCRVAGKCRFSGVPITQISRDHLFKGVWFCETLCLVSIKIGNRRICININSPCREPMLLYNHRDGI